MRAFLVFATLPFPFVVTFSLNPFDLGFLGFYPRQRFHSVAFEPPTPKQTQWNDRCDFGYLFLTPRGWAVPSPGPVMLDAKGNLVWMENKFGQALNFNVQKYKGQDHMTFWTGTDSAGVTINGSYTILNSSYEVVQKVYAYGIDLAGDLHEFRITPQGTALMTIYYTHQVDCTDIGLGKGCWIKDSLFQEVDIETGNLLFEWRATDHISLSEVYVTPGKNSKKKSYDFFHINSVDKTDAGDYIISSRYLHAIVCVSAETGDILWQLGGKSNSFESLNGATDFKWQHHATWQGNDTIALFDNHGNNVFHSPFEYSKGMLIQLDMADMTATLLKTYIHPDQILAISQGSMQVTPNGNVLVGFGNSPAYTEFTVDGEVLCSAHFGPHLIFEILDIGLLKSYRTFKGQWVGRPKTVPDVKVDGAKAYVSWNGATEVKYWVLETAKMSGKDAEFMKVQEMARDRFETSFRLGESDKFVRMVALDGAKNVLAYSAIVSTTSPAFLSLWLILFLIFSFTSLLVLCWRYKSLLARILRSSLSKIFPTLANIRMLSNLSFNPSRHPGYVKLRNRLGLYNDHQPSVFHNNDHDDIEEEALDYYPLTHV